MATASTDKIHIIISPILKPRVDDETRVYVPIIILRQDKTMEKYDRTIRNDDTTKV